MNRTVVKSNVARKVTIKLFITEWQLLNEQQMADLLIEISWYEVTRRVTWPQLIIVNVTAEWDKSVRLFTFTEHKAVTKSSNDKATRKCHIRFRDIHFLNTMNINQLYFWSGLIYTNLHNTLSILNPASNNL